MSTAPEGIPCVNPGVHRGRPPSLFMEHLCNRVLDPQRKKAIYAPDTTSIYAVFSMFKGNSQNIYLSIYGFRLRPKELKQLFFGAPEVWQLLCICTYTAPLTFI